MRRKITAGLILRKDGRYQRNELIGDKRRTFTAKDPAKVWADIQKAQEEYEEQECQRIITRDSGPLFSVVSDEYQAIVEKMKEGTRRSEKLGNVHVERDDGAACDGLPQE